MRRCTCLFIALFISFSLHARPLVFAPLPFFNSNQILEDFFPMVNYLEEALDENIAFHYEKKYDDIIAAFKANKIDIAYFGPLPFLTLQKSFPYALPIITFHESDGERGYRCALVKFAGDTLSPKATLKVALTQPLSTCGYTKTKVLVNDYLHTNLDTMLYRYVGTHDEVALSIIRGDFQMGGMKESIAKEYASLGLEVIQTTSLIPGFSLVVNTQTLSLEQIEKIKSILLAAPKEVYQTWGKDIRYGMSETDMEMFKHLKSEIETFNVPQSGSF
ncbi:MAG: PhnD/SsuA/transferrin family substrate-binding protein [Sulfurospirillum sp.]